MGRTPICCGAIAIALTIGLGAAPNSKKLPPEPTAILPAEPVWTKLLDTPPSAAGAMDAEQVYVPIQGGGVRAFTRDTGRLLWSADAGTAWPPVAAGASVLVAIPDGILALDAATGARGWLCPLERPLSAPFTTHEGRAIVATAGGEAIAIDVSTGDIAWRQTLGAPTRHPAAFLGSDLLVYSLENGSLIALDPKSGKQLWKRTLAGRLSAPATARDRVFVGSTNNFFYALDDDTGEERWRWRTGGDVIGAASEGDRVYFAALDNVLRAVKRDNGNQLWKAAIPTRPSMPPLAFGGIVLQMGAAPRVEAYVGKTGAPLGSYAAPSDLQGVPLIDTAPEPFAVTIVALMRDGQIAGLRPTALTFPDPPLEPLLKLPGRELPPEPRPVSRPPTHR